MSDNPEEDKPRRKAVALHYNNNAESAPKVVATGSGYVAEQIIALAEEHGIHIHEDRDLVAVLSTLDVHAEIPEHLYKAVAEILAFVYRLNREFSD